MLCSPAHILKGCLVGVDQRIRGTRRDSGRYSPLRDTGPFLRPRHAASSGRPRWQRGGTLDESQTIFNGSSVDTAYMGTTYLLKYFYPHFQHQLKTFKT